MRVPNLRYWRERRALTQVELAEKANVSVRSVAGYEAGMGAYPGSVRKLAEALDVSVEALMPEPEVSKAIHSSATPPSLQAIGEQRPPTVGATPRVAASSLRALADVVDFVQHWGSDIAEHPDLNPDLAKQIVRLLDETSYIGWEYYRALEQELLKTQEPSDIAQVELISAVTASLQSAHRVLEIAAMRTDEPQEEAELTRLTNFEERWRDRHHEEHERPRYAG